MLTPTLNFLDSVADAAGMLTLTAGAAGAPASASEEAGAAEAGVVATTSSPPSAPAGTGASARTRAAMENILTACTKPSLRLPARPGECGMKSSGAVARGGPSDQRSLTSIER